MKVAFITRYRRDRASSRVRAYEMADALREYDIATTIVPLAERGAGMARVRFAVDALRAAHLSDVVILQKPSLPTWFVDTLANVNPRIVVDFDDAVWVPPPGADPERATELGRRLDHAIAQARWVTTGSALLARAVRRGFPDAVVRVVPSSVDLARIGPTRRHRSRARPVAGWIGSVGNLRDLEPIAHVVAKALGAWEFRVVSGELPPGIPGLVFEPWHDGGEGAALRRFDLGIMPLIDDQRSRGRCGFKAVQYMAAGLPVIASDVGASKEVVEHGVTGFLAADQEQWVSHLERLAGDVELRQEMGAAGRIRVRQLFSFEVNARRLADFLNDRATA